MHPGVGIMHPSIHLMQKGTRLGQTRPSYPLPWVQGSAVTLRASLHSTHASMTFEPVAGSLLVVDQALTTGDKERPKRAAVGPYSGSFRTTLSSYLLRHCGLHPRGYWETVSPHRWAHPLESILNARWKLYLCSILWQVRMWQAITMMMMMMMMMLAAYER